jgi:hypothetical protein
VGEAEEEVRNGKGPDNELPLGHYVVDTQRGGYVYDHELTARYHEYLRDKRSADDLDKGLPWCVKCQEAHKNPHAVPDFARWATIHELRESVKRIEKGR